MTGSTPTSGTRPPTNTIIGLILAIILVIAALTFIDSTLEKVTQRDLRSQAEQAHRAGVNFVKQGKAAQGIELLRKAQALERTNTLYELDLVDALIAAGKTDEAEPLMNEIMLREPDDGRANLSAARLMRKRGRNVDAASYYHRAIYGDWPKDAASHRISARMELVHLLVADGRNKELLAELLPLQEEAANDTPIQKTLGHLFLVAGSPFWAASAYQAMIDHDPKDAEAYAGLGETKLVEGQYHAAHTAFRAALRYRPEDEAIRRRLELSSTLTDLDPTPRQLTSRGKYRRSLHILQLAYEDINACTGTPSGETAQLLSAARDALAAKPPSNATNELSEGVLGMAEKIWKTRIKACAANISPEEEPLHLIVEKLAQ
jgi:thioredoxin-like negative regulator of GroEL